MWLLETKVRQMIEAAEASGMIPTLEEQTKFEARYSAEDEDGSPRILTTAGDVGQISVQGIMTKTPSFMAMLFGGGNTTYSEILSAMAVAEQDPSVKEIVFAIDSPGGQFDGLFDVLAAQKVLTKPTRSVVSGVGASAAFAIAVQSDKVEASNRAARLGSVGVVATFGVSEHEVSITSTEAPDKRPDVTTEAGKATVRVELDAMHHLFAEAIADGRGTTIENVNAEFGQGATLLADEALSRGMIDSIAGATLSVPSSNKQPVAASAGTKTEVLKMDLNELKASHPATYAAAVAVGQEQAVAGERDRVNAHLTMGEASGDMKTATKAVLDGSPMTEGLRATYYAAGMNRGSVETRSAEEIAAAAALDNVETDDGEAQETAAVASLETAVFDLCGAEKQEG